MAEGVVAMRVRERERAFLVRYAVEGRLSQREASERAGIGVRQFKRLVRAWRRDGDGGLVSRQRGRPSHRRLSEALRLRIGGLLQATYADFGPTLAAEKLAERDGIKVSAETVRRLQIELGLWRPRKRRARRVFRLRERRPRFGELIQIDGSPHDWFEGRGPRCTLIVFIDDATGRLTALRFAPVESCLSGDVAGSDTDAWPSVGVLFGSPWHFPGQRQGCGGRRWQDRVRPGGGSAGDRADQRADAAGEGPGGAGEPDVAGSSDQGDAAAQHQLDCGGTDLSAVVRADMEREVRRGTTRRDPGAPALDEDGGRA